jgi:hypothetical protein
MSNHCRVVSYHREECPEAGSYTDIYQLQGACGLYVNGHAINNEYLDYEGIAARFAYIQLGCVYEFSNGRVTTMRPLYREESSFANVFIEFTDASTYR